MLRRLSAFLGVFATIGALAAVPPAGASSAAVGAECEPDDWGIGTRIVGRVLDSSGAGVAEAEIRAYSKDPSVRPSAAVSYPDGVFHLGGLDPAASYYLAARPPGDDGRGETWHPGGVGSESLADTVTDLRPCLRNGLLPSDIVVGEDLKTITSTSRPTTRGPVKVNSFVEAQDGGWSEPDAQRTAQWYADGESIGSGSGMAYLLKEPQLGKRITVVVTAWKQGFRPTRVSSVATGPVGPGDIRAEQAPTVVGKAAVGSTLRAGRGAWRTDGGALAGVAVRHTWFRGGTTVGTGASYRVTTKDVGANIMLKVTASRAAHLPTTVTSRPTATVRKVPSTTTLSVRRQGAGRATLRVVVRTPGVSKPGGYVTVRDGSSVVDRVKISPARHATIRLSKLRAGKHRLSATYSGSPVARSSRGTTRVTIRR